MKSKTFLKLVISGAMIFHCLCSFADCDLSMKSVQILNGSSLYKTKITFKEGCSSGMAKKIKISSIELKIYKSKKLITVHNFDNGIWIPDLKKFILSSKSEKVECMSDSSKINLDLRAGVLNSVQGTYLNLKSGVVYNFTCEA